MKRLITTIALLLFAHLACAQVVIDSVGTAQTLGGVTSKSFSHTASGSNRAVYLFVASASLSPAPTITATYGGTSMTQVATITNTNYGSSVTGVAKIFRLLAPATGSQTVAVTFTSGGGNSVGLVQTISFTGVHQTTPEGTPVTSNPGSTVTSDTVTVTDSVSGDFVIDAFDADAGASTITASQTQRGNIGDSGYKSGVQTAAGAASVAMMWTPSSAEFVAHSAIAVKQAAAAPSTVINPISGKGGAAAQPVIVN